MLPWRCPGRPEAGVRGRNRHYCCCRFWSLFRRRIFFLRHFHLAFPRFFQSLELRFIGDSPFSGRPRPVPSAWVVTGPDTTRTFIGFSDAPGSHSEGLSSPRCGGLGPSGPQTNRSSSRTRTGPLSDERARRDLNPRPPAIPDLFSGS